MPTRTLRLVDVAELIGVRAARHEGNPGLIRVELGVALATVHEWFPVRTLVADTLERAGLQGVDSTHGQPCSSPNSSTSQC